MGSKRKFALFPALNALIGLMGLVCTTFSASFAVEGTNLKALRGGDKDTIPEKMQQATRGELLVKLRKGVSRRQVMRRRPSYATEKLFSGLYKRFNRLYLHVISDTFSAGELLDLYRLDPSVESASPNYARKLHRLSSDPYFGQLWGLRNTGQSVQGVQGQPGADIHAADAWDICTGKSSVVVAVIDSGVYYDHEDLFPNMWKNQGEIPGNGIDDDGNGYPDDVYGYDFAADNSGDDDSDPMDIDTHGSHVAGTIAAVGDNAIGTTGVAWQVKIMALKAMRPNGLLYDSDTMQAVEYAVRMKERGVNVVAINASYGASGGEQSDPLNDIISEAGRAGIVFVASAGNSATNNDEEPQFPASYDAPNIISVAATDQFDHLAPFSNYGQSSVDLAAPGENIFSTVPEIDSSVSSEGKQYQGVPFEYAACTAGITGALYNCGKGYPEEFPPGVAGNVALIERGSKDGAPFYFSDKVRNAMNASAGAAIIYNDVAFPDLADVTLQTAGDWIPAVFLSQSDGKILASRGTPTVTVINRFLSGYQYLDGTSMASPHVAGTLAILASEFPHESISRRIKRVLHGVDRLESLSGKVATGGRLNLYGSSLLFPVMPLAPIYQMLLSE